MLQRRPGGGGLLIFEAASYAERAGMGAAGPDDSGRSGELDLAGMDPRQRGWLAMSRCTSPAW